MSPAAKPARGQPTEIVVWRRIRPLLKPFLERRGGKSEAAKHIGVTPAAVAQWFTLTERAPTASNMLKLIRLAGHDPSEIAPELFGHEPIGSGKGLPPMSAAAVQARDRQWLEMLLVEQGFPPDVARATARQTAYQHDPVKFTPPKIAEAAAAIASRHSEVSIDPEATEASVGAPAPRKPRKRK